MAKMKILIVDDEEYSLDLLKSLLEKEYQVECAENGFSALKKVDSFLPDLILLDVMMPGLNGFEVCKKINSNSKYADIPIIMITARVDEDDIKEGFDNGAIDYIRKPFTVLEVLLRVKNVLKMRRSILQLKELNTIKDEFVSMVSHDLKSPLTTIAGYCEILLDEKSNSNLTPKQHKMLKEIQNSSRYQHEIIKNLLNLSMLDSGKMKLNKREFLLIDAINASIDELKFKIDKKKIDIKINVDDNLKIFADFYRIIQVLMNIIANSLKYTDNGGVIDIDTHKKSDSIIVSIKDTGIGISQEDIEKIFNPYQIFSTHGVKGEKGTGLGLNICMRIINAHDGKIWVESEVGKGSSFYFMIPDQTDN
jgi:two-component system, sensor histidine kinase and response regulator